MVTKPLSVFTTQGRTRYRPRHFAPVLVARLVLVVLALIGAIAMALLVLGLLNAHAVTNHFGIVAIRAKGEARSEPPAPRFDGSSEPVAPLTQGSAASDRKTVLDQIKQALSAGARVLDGEER